MAYFKNTWLKKVYLAKKRNIWLKKEYYARVYCALETRKNPQSNA